MQRRATLWIVGAFCTSSTASIKAIASLIPIYLHIQKLNRRFHLRAYFLLSNHIINFVLEARLLNHKNFHQYLLEWLTPRQCLNIKGSIIDINNRFNKVFPSFSFFNSEFSSKNRLIDIFSNHFSFHLLNKKCENKVKNYLYKLENITL